MKSPLNDLRSNVYSQNGEDGVIRELIRQLGIVRVGTCVEFGAWDGVKFSNTFNLVENYGWNALYIEGDRDKFHSLLDTAARFPRITPCNAWVDFEHDSETSLDNLLLKNNIQTNFDLLSIDIDSYDLEVWQGMKHFLPTIVVIEVNSEIPLGIRQTHLESGRGSSFTSMLEVGQNKGYSLVCHTGNMIFVKSEYIPILDIDERLLRNPELLFDGSWVPLRLRMASIIRKSVR